MDNEENKSLTDLEWQQRILCRDESCIGIIGPDGRCKECGLPYEGPFDSLKTETDEVDDEVDDEADFEAEDAEENGYEEPEEFEEDDTDPPSDPEWEQRKLCSDESCIGVIGPDGRCKECGKPYVENSEG